MMLMMSDPRTADQKLSMVKPANIDAMTNTLDSMGATSIRESFLKGISLSLCRNSRTRA
jgi:hypothetical protein